MSIPQGHIRVRFFSVLRDLTGVGELEVEVRDAVTVSDVELRLIERYPDIRPYASVWRAALNQHYVASTASIKSGDELALITPVSGG